VELDKDGWLTVTDNGPRHPGRSASEIQGQVGARSDHDDAARRRKIRFKVYETSGGLHGVGRLVVNALSERLDVEVALDRKLYRQSFVRGKPQGKLKEAGETQNRRGTKIRFHPDPQNLRRQGRVRSGPAFSHGALEGVSLRRGGNPLELRSVAHPRKERDTGEGELSLPRGLKDYLAETLVGETSSAARSSPARSSRQGGHGSVEWAIAWFAGDGFTRSYCNTITTPEGGTHEAGLKSALLRGFKAYADLTGNKRAAQITSDDIMTSCGAMLSVFLREPEFVGQTKDRLASVDAIRVVEKCAPRRFRSLARGIAEPGESAPRNG